MYVSYAKDIFIALDSYLGRPAQRMEIAIELVKQAKTAFSEHEKI